MMSRQTTKKLTEKQRLELDRFVKKMETLVPSEYQEIIFDRARSQAGRFVVDAGPGSGKTTTAIKASSYFRGRRSLFLAFNKRIQEDTQLKLKAIKSKATASTLHSFGLSCLIAYKSGQWEVNEEKYETIIKDLLKVRWVPFLQSLGELDKERPSRVDCQIWTEQLLHFAQISLSGVTEQDLLNLIDEFDLDEINPSARIWPLVVTLVSAALEIGKQKFEKTGEVSFDDMLYYPHLFPDVPVRTYDHIILDEAQDASKAGLALLKRACTSATQVFAIGDAKQSINAFAGADEQSIPRIIEAFQAEILSLRVCYRCGTSIIGLANQLGGNIIPAPDAKPGKVEVLPREAYLKMLQPGDAVVARTRAALVQDCLKVLQTGRRAKVLGKDLGRSIAAIVSRLQEMRIPALRSDLSNFAEVLQHYHHKKREEVQERKNLKNKDLALDELNDQVETVKAFYLAYISKCIDHNLIDPENDPQAAYDRTSDDLKTYIKNLFVEDEDSGLILFMTAHRSKGGEWARVFVIETDRFPHPKAKSDKQQRQEENLMYVAITRAIDYLCFVDKPFTSLEVSGYEPNQQQGLTIISAPSLGHLEIHPTSVAIGDQDSRSPFEETVTAVAATMGVGPEPLAEGRVARIAAIEVLCPACGSACVDRAESALITYDLVGHTVSCSACRKPCIVPLNAFSLGGNVIAREKPAQAVPNSRLKKKGRTQKERKSNAGRKTKSGQVRQPLQLSLDVRTIRALNALGVNKSELFEELLQQYQPFLEIWASLDDDEKLNHDEIGESEHTEQSAAPSS